MSDEFNWTPDELQAIVDEHALVVTNWTWRSRAVCGRSSHEYPSGGVRCLDTSGSDITRRSTDHGLLGWRPR